MSKNTDISVSAVKIIEAIAHQVDSATLVDVIRSLTKQPEADPLAIEESDDVSALMTALSKAQGKFTTVPKTKTGRGKGGTLYKYADWSDILKETLPTLSAEGLALTQRTWPCIADGNLYIRSEIWHGESAQFMRSFFPVCSLSNMRQQDFGENITYAKRYGGSALLGISTEEDTDTQGSEAKTEGNSRKTMAKNATSQPAPDPETGEVKAATSAADQRANAETLYADIVGPDLDEEAAKTLADSIDNYANSGDINKKQQETLQQALHARKMILGANTFEGIESAREAISAVSTYLTKDGKLEGFLKARAAEIGKGQRPTK